MSSFLTFAAWFGACIGFWALALTVYTWLTPYREFALIQQGNMAAALSLGGTAAGLAAPLVSLSAHSVSLYDLAVWAVVALLVQLALWVGLSLTLLRGLREAIVADRRSVGLIVGVLSACIGALNAGSLTT